MTYQQKLEALSKDREQKAHAFIEAIHLSGQYSAQVSCVRSEWEEAERAFIYCANFVQSGKVDLHDIAIY